MKKCSKSYWPQLGLTLIIGASGGWLFTRLGTPLPWMLGALSATMVGSMVGLPLQVPQLFRRLWIIVLGVMLGSCFGPETLDHMVLWGGSFAGMIAFVTFATLAVAWFYNRFGKFDRNTALFCATPGGLGEMAILGPALGADEKTIVLTHATRIVMVMACVPPAYALMEGYVPAPNLGSKGGLSDANLYDLAILGIAGFGGALLAKVLRLPAWQMCGSMFASAAIHAANITSATPPQELVAFAQIVIGSGAGARFAGSKPHELVKPVALSALATLLVLLMAAAVAYAISLTLNLDFRAVHLSYSPGGFAEMSLIALALGIEAPFVAVHHMGRIFVVVIMASVLGRVLQRSTR
ncbi:MAG: AbrB family transcriptional regulator [Rhodospirillales bacterium]